MMENGGLSAADVMALTKNNDNGYLNGMAGMWNNPFVYLIWLAFFGGGFGNWNRNGGEALTQAELQRGFDTNTIVNKLDGISNGLCDGFYAMNNGFKDGFYSTQAAIAENRFAQQNCCCETNRNIDAVRAENYKNTCEITNTTRAEGAATRSLITQQEMQNLRDKLEEKDREILTLNLFAAQQAQTQNLIAALRPFPTPAYITGLPYTNSANTCGCGV